MLLAQPFEPHQNRLSIIGRAKRAIALIKSRKMRHQQFIPLAPPPMPMYYDPYMMVGPPMIPPQLQALLSHQMPYAICLHFNAPCEHLHYPPVAESAASTLHSARSSIYEQEEKEEVMKPTLTRSNSDTLHDRPSMTHNKWNTSVNGFYSQ